MFGILATELFGSSARWTTAMPRPVMLTTFITFPTLREWTLSCPSEHRFDKHHAGVRVIHDTDLSAVLDG